MLGKLAKSFVIYLLSVGSQQFINVPKYIGWSFGIINGTPGSVGGVGLVGKLSGQRYIVLPTYSDKSFVTIIGGTPYILQFVRT